MANTPHPASDWLPFIVVCGNHDAMLLQLYGNRPPISAELASRLDGIGLHWWLLTPQGADATAGRGGDVVDLAEYELNDEQVEALHTAVSFGPVSLLQGPPPVGCSVTDRRVLRQSRQIGARTSPSCHRTG